MSTLKELLEQSLREIESRAQNPYATVGITTGFKDLDRELGGFSPSDLVVVGARPAMGKSALLLNMALKQAVDNNIAVLFYSMEKTQLQITQQIISAVTAIEGYKLANGFLSAEEWSKLMDVSSQRLTGAPLYIADDTPTNITQFCKRVEEDVRRTGARIVYLDNLHLFSSSLGCQNRYEEIAACTRSLKHLAKSLNIPVVVASQINRNPTNRNSATEERYKPQMYDLGDSGTICEDANVVLLLDRPEMRYRSTTDPEGRDIRGLVEVDIAKNHMGREGIVELLFTPECFQMEDRTEQTLSAPSDTASTPGSIADLLDGEDSPF